MSLFQSRTYIFFLEIFNGQKCKFIGNIKRCYRSSLHTGQVINIFRTYFPVKLGIRCFCCDVILCNYTLQLDDKFCKAIHVIVSPDIHNSSVQKFDAIQVLKWWKQNQNSGHVRKHVHLRNGSKAHCFLFFFFTLKTSANDGLNTDAVSLVVPLIYFSRMTLRSLTLF